MKKRLFALLLWTSFVLQTASLLAQPAFATITSPDRNLRVRLYLKNPNGELRYEVSRRNLVVLESSSLGITFKEEDFTRGLKRVGLRQEEHEAVWHPVLGEERNILDHHKEAIVSLQNLKGAKMDLIVRVFNDGVAFRYSIPQGGNWHTVSEATSFDFSADHTAWWLPGDWDSNEHRHTTSPISKINTEPYKKDEPSIYTMHLTGKTDVQTPLTLRTAEGIHIAIIEAAQSNFPALYLTADTIHKSFAARLTPSPNPEFVAVNQGPFATPWRCILIAPDAPSLLASRLVLNVNEPSKIADPSWIKPSKYVGVWWEMHIGKATWELYKTENGKQVPNGKHGANTANVKRYIDFAAKYGFDGVLVEGWNPGWEEWFGKQKDEVFDFKKSYPDFEVEEVSRYAKEKGVKLIMHHETSSAVVSYERQMDSAYAFMKKYGYPSVKTGYVGYLIPRGEWHDGQWMAQHYVRVAERTAANQLMVVSHEAVRPSGLNRTYPNWLAAEAGRGQEFNGWSRGNLPEHETILPFTRFLGGPMDYTPGIFDITFGKAPNLANDPEYRQVHTTVAKQLALYVTIYSPVQMAADLPENYEKRLDAFQFIRDVAVDWDTSIYVNAAIGDYMTVARKARGKDAWFIGSITDEFPRELSVPLTFLKPGKTYTATLYEDGPDAHWQKNPSPVTIRTIQVKQGDVLPLKLAAGGGCAVSLMMN